MKHRDPFDVLERRLTDAVGRRARPRTRSWRGGALALGVAALVGGGAIATAGVLSSDRPSAVDTAIVRGQRAAARLPACTGPLLRHGAPTVVAGEVSPQLTARYRIFRRPARRADRAGIAAVFRAEVPALRSGLRVARAADGTRFSIAVSRGVIDGGRRDFVACAIAARDAAVASVPPQETALRAHVARVMDGRVAATRRNTAPEVQTLWVRSQSPHTRASGVGATLVRPGRRVPSMYGTGTARRDGRRVRLVSGLVPDGVAVVRAVSTGRGRSRSVSTRVQDNVFALTVPAGLGPHVALQWRSVDGQVIRTLHPFG